MAKIPQSTRISGQISGGVTPTRRAISPIRGRVATPIKIEDTSGLESLANALGTTGQDLIARNNRLVAENQDMDFARQKVAYQNATRDSFIQTANEPVGVRNKGDVYLERVDEVAKDIKSRDPEVQKRVELWKSQYNANALDKLGSIEFQQREGDKDDLHSLEIEGIKKDIITKGISDMSEFADYRDNLLEADLKRNPALEGDKAELAKTKLLRGDSTANAHFDNLLSDGRLQDAVSFFEANEKDKGEVEGLQSSMTAEGFTKLQSKITKAKKVLQTQAKAKLADSLSRADDAIEANKQGITYLSETGETAESVLRDLTLMNTKSSREKTRDLKSSMKIKPKVEEFTAFTPREQATKTAQLESKLRSSSASKTEMDLLDAYRSVSKQQVSAINSGNGYSYAVRMNIAQNAPLDMKNSIAFEDSLRERNKQVKVASEHMQVKVPVFNKVEVGTFTDTLDGSTPTEAAKFLGSLVKGLGSDAEEAISLISTKDSGVYAAAGGLILEGKSNVALEVLKGRSVLKADSGVVNPREFNLQVDDKIRDAYINQPEQLQMISNAVKSVYAQRSQLSGVDRSLIDSNLMDEVIRDVTNGIISFNESAIEAPVTGMTSLEFETGVNNIKPEDIDAMGGVSGFDNKAFVKVLSEEDVKLESIGSGKYLVSIIASDGTPQNFLSRAAVGQNMTGATVPFILDYEKFSHRAIKDDGILGFFVERPSKTR